MLYYRNHNSVTRPDIVQQEVTERVEGFVSYHRCDRECATIDLCPGGRRGQRSNVADGATDFVEQVGPSFRGGRFRQRQVLRRRLRRPDEAGEAVYIGESVWPGLVIWLGHGVTKFGHLVGEQLRGNTYLIQVGVTRERQKARMLIFPTESANAGLPPALQQSARK